MQHSGSQIKGESAWESWRHTERENAHTIISIKGIILEILLCNKIWQSHHCIESFHLKRPSKHFPGLKLETKKVIWTFVNNITYFVPQKRMMTRLATKYYCAIKVVIIDGHQKVTRYMETCIHLAYNRQIYDCILW